MSRQNKFLFIILCILAVYMTGCGSFRKFTKTETEKFTINAASKRALTLDNVSGNITIIKSQDSTVKITAVKEVLVRKKDLDKPFDEVKIVIDTLTDNIRIDYDTRDYDDGPFSKMRRPEVNYTIAVPSFLSLKIDNNSGNIILNNLENDIVLGLIYGEVSLEHVSGNIKADINSGDVTGTIDSTKGMIFDIINGDVRLTLGPNVNAKVRADWIHGKLEYDGLTFMNVDRYDNRDGSRDNESFKGTLGSGLYDIRIDMTNGKIRFFGNGTSTTL
ncbi:MAG TPA: DUF4097 family beta strand repeat-containing protein [Ignavibacteria bacterium]|nr:DUF4097 family beta strand repeat-containing protein [Ignavibacteria bacterium]